MKKICFITTVPITIKAFILNTAIYLYKEGKYDITFISNDDEEFRNIIPSYINFIPLKMKRGIGIDGINDIFKLFKIFKKEKFDLIQYSTPNASLYASIAGKMAKIKVRLYCQWGIRYVGFEGVKRKIFKFIEKRTCKNSTWIEPDSFGNLKFSHKEKLYGPEKSSVIWNGSASGVDLNKFDISKKEIWKKEIRDKYNLGNSIVLGFIGRLEKDKGVNELFQAFKNIENSNIKLLMVGGIDKPDTIDKDLYSWAINNENIFFTGKVNDAEKYYSAMDIFILPSYREGFGSVVVEAEAMGVPVIVTNIPGPTDAMVENETGLIAEKGNSKSLQNRIEELIKNEDMRIRMSKKAIEFANNNFECDKLHKYILEDRNRLLEKE